MAEVAEVSEAIQTGVETVKKDSLVNGIWSTLEKAADRKYIEPARRLRQKETLQRLSTDFETELTALASIHRQSEHLGSVLAGKIFEELVRRDPQIFAIEEPPEAKLLRSLMQDPKRYGLQREGLNESIRNSDIAVFDEAGKELIGVIEAKSGAITYGNSVQISEFKKKLVKVVGILGTIKAEVLEQHGLGVLAKGHRKLRVASDFLVTLAVPFGSYRGDTANLLQKKDFKTPAGINLAKERLANCEIVESAFSRNDLGIITDHVVHWLQLKEQIKA